MYNSRRLTLYHCWVAFALFLPAVVLGAWQMLMRSPLPRPLQNPNAYYLSVTLHGTVMAYVVTTYFAMGFGYAVTATSLGRPIRGVWAAWIGFALCLARTTATAALAGKASRCGLIPTALTFDSAGSFQMRVGVILFGLAMIRGDFDAEGFNDYARQLHGGGTSRGSGAQQ